MLLEHAGKKPQIANNSYVAPNAVVCGQVRVGQNVRIMFGAQIIAENSAIEIGDNCIVLENAVIRGTENHPVTIGNNCLIGPHAHVAGCVIEDNVFIATGASVFHGATVGSGAEVRINGVVHLNTTLAPNTTVPIGWVAVGNPAQILPPNCHDEIWALQKPLNFPLTVYGVERPSAGESNMETICKTMAQRLANHCNDTELP